MRMTKETSSVLIAMGKSGPPGGPIYQRQVCDLTGLASGSVATIMRRLETFGWLEGEWEDVDQRAVGRRRRHYYRMAPPAVVWYLERLEEEMRRLMPLANAQIDRTEWVLAWIHRMDPGIVAAILGKAMINNMIRLMSEPGMP